MKLVLSRGGPPLFVGVVHLPATPGAPRYGGSMHAVLERAAEDARALAENGADALIVENFGDAPFFGERVPPETVAALALALDVVRREAGSLPLGVNVLRNDARAALGICAAAGASFVRVNVHVGAMLTDQGLLEGRAAATLRERARIAPDVVIAADVHVKHAVPLAGERLEDAARETFQRGLADVLIVTGARTGSPPSDDELERVRERVPEAPLWIGSGLSAENAGRLARLADGAVVGTSLKRDGRVSEPVDPARVARLRSVLDGR